MNSEIAKRRLSEVVRIDTITSSYGDFLATHLPFKKIYVEKEFKTDVNQYYTEEEVYNDVILNPSDTHQFVLVIGSSGAGKSHLIRWAAIKMEKEAKDDEVVLFVRRSDNTLKGTIRQLLEKPEVESIPNKDVYKRLVNASSNIDENKLKDMIYQFLIVEIQNDDGTNAENLSNVDRKRIVPLLQNELFQNRMYAENGPIDRIFSKVAENETKNNRDIAAEFYPKDFEIDISFCDKVQNDGGDKKAVKMLEKLHMEDELPEAVAHYLNTMIDVVIQRCAGLEPGDFEQVFLEIRRELKRQNKKLTLLIEDITAFTGVNVALLNVLTTWHTGDYKKDDICRISSIIGTTSQYYQSNFRDNYKDRVTQFVIIPDDVFGAKDSDLCEFVGRYLNTMSMEAEDINTWVNSGASMSEYPIHTITQGEGWDTITTEDGKRLNLFPFTKNAIVYLYNTVLQENYRTPRYLLRDIVEKTVRDALWNFEKFPGFKIINSKTNADLRERLRSQNISNELFERMYLFMCIWGDATTDEYLDGDIKYISSLSTKVYDDMKFPIITGKKVYRKSNISKSLDESINSAMPKNITLVKPKVVQRSQAEIAQLNDSFQVIENWVAGGTINVGATTGNVVLLSKAREDMCNYLYSAINWQAEGVSMDNIDKVKKVKTRLVGFERQKRGEDAMFYKLPADRETQVIVEAFIEWNILGKRSWNFDGAAKHVYRIQLWVEKIKKPLIAAITTFEERDIDYYKCAMVAEFYRIILLGLSKASTMDGLKAEQIFENGVKKPGVNSHCASWNSLADIVTRNDSDRINRETVIQYFNIIQGDSHAQVFLDRKAFDSLVRQVKSEGLRIESDILDSMDPVKLRRDARDYVKSIQERLCKVREDEIEKANGLITVIEASFGTLEIDDEDIEDLVDEIMEFYRMAEESKITAKYDQDLFDDVKKYSKSTSQAIKDIDNARKAEDVLECILIFSQDPIRKVEKLYTLLDKVTNDIRNVGRELQGRREKLGGNTDSLEKNNLYNTEKEYLLECKNMLERMVNNHVE